MQTILLERHFPEFPLDELPNHPSGLFEKMMRDCSSKANQRTPAFCLEDKTTIWMAVDRAEARERYLGPKAPRFKVFYDDDGLTTETYTVYQGDDFEEVLETIMALDTLTEEIGNLDFSDIIRLWPSAVPHIV